MAEGDSFYYEPAGVVVRRRRATVRSKRPILTFALIAICTLLFFLDLVYQGYTNTSISDFLAFTPATAFSQPWTWITAIFVHAGFVHAGLDHLFFNMFALFIFGIYLEPRITRNQYLLVFFAAGILGNFAYWLSSPFSAIPAVGASGAIYGIMAMLAVLYPRLIVYVGFAPMPIIFAAVLWFVLEFTGLFVPSDIAHQAHIAGLAVGVLYGLYIRRQRNKLVFFWEK